MSDIAIIGSGFSALSAAAVLAQKGHNVTVYEKNNELGEHVSLKQRVTLLIWAQAGTGCLMFLINFLIDLTKNHLTLQS